MPLSKRKKPRTFSLQSGPPRPAVLPLYLNPQPSPGPESHLPTEALARIRNGLRGHECRGPCRARQLSIIPLELVADPKVGDLHVAIVPKEQIGWLDVPVDDLLAVHCRREAGGHASLGGITAQSPSPALTQPRKQAAASRPTSILVRREPQKMRPSLFHYASEDTEGNLGSLWTSTTNNTLPAEEGVRGNSGSVCVWMPNR